MRELAIVHGPWLAIALGALALLVGALVELAWRRLSAHRRWTARLRARGIAAPASVADAAGCFAGVIRIEGAPCESFEGRPCAVATLAAAPRAEGDLYAVSRRADRVTLEMGSQRVIVSGPMELVGDGRSLRSAGSLSEQEAEGASFLTLTAESRFVRDGERVRIAGVLRQRAAGAAGYRDSARTLVLEGVRGPVLVAVRRRRVPMIGACAALLACSVATIAAGRARVLSMELVSPLSRHDAIQALSPRERLLRIDAGDHGARAAALRELGDVHGALREARLGSDIASRHEQLVTLDALGRTDELVPVWIALVEAIDGRCRKTGRCLDRARLMSMTLTPDHFGGAAPNRYPIAVFLSQRSVWEDGETTLALGRALWDLEPKSALLAQLRIAWLLELGGLLTITGELEGAERSLERARAALGDARITRVVGERYARDIDHLSTILYLRGGRVSWRIRTTHENGWCPMREPVEVASHRTGRGWPSSWRSLPIEFSERLEFARVAGSVTPEMLETEEGAGTTFEYAFWFARVAGAESFASLAQMLDRPRCPPVRTIEELVRETSRSRALGELRTVSAIDWLFGRSTRVRALGPLDLVSAARRTDACVAPHRDLVEGPWSSPPDGAARVASADADE